MRREVRRTGRQLRVMLVRARIALGNLNIGEAREIMDSILERREECQ